MRIKSLENLVTEKLILSIVINEQCFFMKAVADRIMEKFGLEERYRNSIYNFVREVANRNNLCPEIKKYREEQEYNKVRKHYREDITLKELSGLTGIRYSRLKKLVKKTRKEYYKERAEKGNPAEAIAHVYSEKPYTKLSNLEIFSRVRDIYEEEKKHGFKQKLAERWGITKEAARQFIKKIDRLERETSVDNSVK